MTDELINHSVFASPTTPANTITFGVPSSTVLVLDKDGMIFRGERILDAGLAYTAFKNWLDQAHFDSEAQKYGNALALIEFVRSHAADACMAVASKHFADGLAWDEEGDVDPLEIAAARGADDGATECRNTIQQLDCHAIFTQWCGK